MASTRSACWRRGRRIARRENLVDIRTDTTGVAHYDSKKDIVFLPPASSYEHYDDYALSLIHISFHGRFLGWTPRNQEGFHMRRVGGAMFLQGAPMVPERPDGRIKPVSYTHLNT